MYKEGKRRINRNEAIALVKHLVNHLQDKHFHYSVGIVTFNAEQQDLIINLLEQARREHPEIEPHFSDENTQAVFVKNLESVQGDERDIIYFSTTYGPDQSGKVAMKFGPMNRTGGQRRLNVAITRAKIALEVFSSLTAEDIDLKRSNALGVKDFKNFLKYAEHGPTSLWQETVPSHVGNYYDSPFEKAVSEALMDKGWIVHNQVGVSSFKIDIGIVDPDKPGHYIAGVECDGATYHRAATARDRDFLRENILRQLGWDIVRIWSYEWWRDPITAATRIDHDLKSLVNITRSNEINE